ncbi:MAG: cytochrome c [Bacteroidia bacterium]|jgi:cytochrome c
MMVKLFSYQVKLIARFFLPVFVVLFCFACGQPNQGKKVLVFSKTLGWRHSSIETGVAALQKLGQQYSFEVDATEDASTFNEDNLKQYDAVIFLNTTGNVLDYYQQADFERYIQSGGGFVGVHAATDTEYDWPWYGRLVGAYFTSHPKIQEAKINVLSTHAHQSLDSIPESFTKTDEFYNFKNINPELNVLMTIDETTYEGGINGASHPMTWYHEYDGGRVFYTNFGHTEETYTEAYFLKMLRGGIEYAMGEGKPDYTKAKSDRIPEENRFVQSVLAENLDEPMEMDVLDKYSVIFVERKGNLRVLNTITQKLETVAKMPVYTKQEDGLIGIAVDPNYVENNWIYLFYSPVGDIPKQHVSRFVFDGKTLDMESEKVVLEIPNQRDECCHSGGSLEFDSKGNLYISVGDDTNPFKSNGFSPMDERPGRSAWDAQKSSANTNDLRGKILRITPQADGTYTIPEGNLFPVGTPDTKPEIFVMGCRNPYRISLDPVTDYLYWGDVGPDAGKSDSLRGSKGIDEINQARQAGFWGWPLTRGNNIPYGDHNFDTETTGGKFDPNNLINNSPNNTGMQKLPPAQNAFIWYSYDESEEFPWVGIGGKTPMAGPIYYSHNFKEANSPFPSYFDGKLIAYEWMRNWIYVITMDENGDYSKAEPFMQNSKFSRPTDMVFGKDGSLFILEYGKAWFKPNFDARLSKIEYVKGNRKPIAKIKADKVVGSQPLEVKFSAAESMDYDGDALSYEWSFTGASIQSLEENPSFTFDNAGSYEVTLVVKDAGGQNSKITKEIKVGNAAPVVKIELANADTTYTDNGTVAYTVSVTDPEDGSTSGGQIKPYDVMVTLHYVPQGKDITIAAQGHQIKQAPQGKELMNGSDCKSCHAIDKKVNGPSLKDISVRYTISNTDYLVKKIIEGGSGVWGETPMSAHPQLSKEDVKKMVAYILSLNAPKSKKDNTMPMKGVVEFTDHIGKKDQNGIYLLKASYLDKGGNSIGSLSASDQVIWKEEK